MNLQPWNEHDKTCLKRWPGNPSALGDEMRRWLTEKEARPDLGKGIAQRVPRASALKGALGPGNRSPRNGIIALSSRTLIAVAAWLV